MNLNLKDSHFLLLSGPCAVESKELLDIVAEKVKAICTKHNVAYVFKSSYKKANRSRIDSFSGIGDDKALEFLSTVRNEQAVPIVTDVHSAAEAKRAAEYVDVLQIPAFLCRQTELLVAAGETGKTEPLLVMAIW